MPTRPPAHRSTTHTSAFLVFVLLTLCPVTHLHAELVRIPSPVEIYDGASTVDSTLRTSPYKFHGRPSHGTFINASAVFLAGRELCSPKRSVVEGKIVVALQQHGYCDMEEAFRELDDKGAVAYVTMVSTIQVGLFCYRHWEIDPWAAADLALIHVEAPIPDFDDHRQGSSSNSDRSRATCKFGEGFPRELEEWCAAADAGDLYLQLSPPWDTTYQDFYESWLWTASIRVALPCWALYVIGNAIVASVHYEKEKAEWGPGRVICLMEIPVLLVIAITLMCGLYGPNLAPLYATLCTFMLFMGFGHITTILLALFMHESTEAIKKGVQRRNVWKLHRRKLLCSLLIFSSFDVLIPIAVYIFAQGGEESGGGNEGRWGFITFFVAFILVNVVICGVYCYEASRYLWPFWRYLRHPASNPSQEYTVRIRKCVFHLQLSVIAMVVQTVGIFLGSSRSTTLAASQIFDPTIVKFIMIFFRGWSRITLSYAQMEAIKTSTDSTLAVLLRRCRSCQTRLIPNRRSALLSPAPYGNVDASPDTTSSLAMTGEVPRQIEDLARVLVPLIRNGSSALPSTNASRPQRREENRQQPPAPQGGSGKSLEYEWKNDDTDDAGERALQENQGGAPNHHQQGTLASDNTGHNRQQRSSPGLPSGSRRSRSRSRGSSRGSPHGSSSASSLPSINEDEDEDGIV